jgi:hypothetical protein
LLCLAVAMSSSVKMPNFRARFRERFEREVTGFGALGPLPPAEKLLSSLFAKPLLDFAPPPPPLLLLVGAGTAPKPLRPLSPNFSSSCRTLVTTGLLALTANPS